MVQITSWQQEKEVKEKHNNIKKSTENKKERRTIKKYVITTWLGNNYKN